MPKTALSKRLFHIREVAGYAENRAAFARKLGISAPSLSDLESGETKSLGKSLPGYIKLGANPHYIFYGKGLPMLKDIEKTLWAQTLLGMILQLDEGQIKTVEDVVKAMAHQKSIVVAPSGPEPRDRGLDSD